MIWGDINIGLGEQGLLRVGPLTLHLQRTEHEIRIAREVSDEPLATATSSFALTESMPAPTERLAAGSDAVIAVHPKMADRSVVGRPETPLVIPSGAELTCYVGTPLWLALSLDGHVVMDFPIFGPSETWFGLPTLGELGYAARTLLRTQRDQLPTRPHRAISAVKIRNESETFTLDRLLIPCRHLAVFSAEGQLWTPDLEIVRRDTTDYDAVTAGSRPTDVKDPVLVSVARDQSGLEALRVLGTWMTALGSRL